jgi:hypothetical protein
MIVRQRATVLDTFLLQAILPWLADWEVAPLIRLLTRYWSVRAPAPAAGDRRAPSSPPTVVDWRATADPR